MGHSYYVSYEHIAFSTKNRVRYLDGDIRPRLLGFLAQASRNLDCPCLIAGGHDDHVHLLVRKGSLVLTPNLIKEIKRCSSVWMKEQGRQYLDFAWQQGYGAFSVSVSMLETVKRYIATQETHHATRSWAVEFRLLLEHHQIEFDERYYLD